MSQSQQLTIEQALSRAKKATKQGNTALAAQLFTAVLQQQPNHPVAKKALRRLQKKLAGAGQAQHKSPSPESMDAVILLYSEGRYAEAQQACKVLLRDYPGSVLVYNLLGSVLQAQGSFDAAVKAFDDAIRLKPDFAEAHGNRGNALKGLGRFPESVASFDRAIQLKPDYAEACYNRGTAFKDWGRFEEAVSSYEKAVLIRPEFAEAHRNLSALKKFEPGDGQVELLEELLARSDLADSARTELYFALAKAREDLGEYDEGFTCLEQGNRLRKQALGYEIDEDEKLFASIKDNFASQCQASGSAPTGQGSVQPIFIVGMMRSGTSLVEQILASHSDVHGAGELEAVNRLAIPLLSSLDINTLRDGYLAALDEFDVSERFVTDKMPLNFRWIGFILSAFPKAKVVHLRRDPMATCWSIYKYYFPDEGNGYAYDMQDLAAYHALYSDLMSFWSERFPDNIYDLCYEDLTENQEEETRKLLAFCELEWQAQCLDFHKTERAVKTTSATQVRKKMYTGSSEVWRNYEHHLQPMIEALEN